MNAILEPRAAASRELSCAHCGQPVPSDARDEFCCRGCRAVARLIRSTGLERYYELRRGEGVPVVDAPDALRDHKWLEPIVARVGAESSASHVALDIQGVHCTACVWLVSELFDRERCAGAIDLNPALGRIDLRIDEAFPLARFVETLESFGYRLGPATERAEAPASDGLLIRAGICLALAGNGMMLSAAIHLGLRSGELHRWARDLAFGAAVLAMVVGSPVFFRSAWAGLRRGVLHLDLPIALGLGLAFVGSVVSYATRGGANYVDTLTAFVALMLLGRWLQTRVLERNQRELLRDAGYEGLLCRRVSGDKTELVPCTHLEVGDSLVVAPGDLVPVRATLLDDAASFSLDWIDGESRPRTFGRGDSIPSGAVSAGESAVRVRVDEAFAASQVMGLLRDRGESGGSERTLAGIPKNIGGLYVTFVLAAAALAGGVTWFVHGDAVRALEVTTATLVVTCPCAFGIAVPLAYEIVQSGLRRSGIYVRRASVFERALAIRTVVFDKTGTLTTGRLGLVSAACIDALDGDDVRALYDLAARSNHPKSRAIAEAVEAEGRAALSVEARVEEVRGRGTRLSRDGSVFRLGSPTFALDDVEAAARLGRGGLDVVFSRDGVLVASFATREETRPETEDELRRISALGCDVFVSSGDSAERCADVARELGIPLANVLSHQSPEDKESFVRAHDAGSVLMVGDGLNDARALAAAGVSATPSVERPFTASRCDFYFVTPGLDPVAQILRASRKLAQVVRADLGIAVAYNALAVALCIAGLMHPWLAAIVMPASSLGTLAFTAMSLRKGSSRWMS